MSIDLALIGAGLFAALWHPPAAWVENAFSNGWYPHWQHIAGAITPVFSFSFGDALFFIALITLIAKLWWSFARAGRRNIFAGLVHALLAIGGLAGLFGVWFYAGWGWGYDRAPVQTRVQYDASRITQRSVDALRKRTIAQLNALAARAHAEYTALPSQTQTRLQIELLRNAWLPVVQALGDRWRPDVSPAKTTIAGFFMNRSGTSGFTDPFTLETQLAPDLLWFERPFMQAHEWSHVAGYNREDEANYIASVTCMRDADAIAQYSGWLETFLYLPQLQHYSKKTFVPLVWQDFAAIRDRNARYVNRSVARASWRVYNSYLRSNRIASGVRNYGEVTRLLAAIPLDRNGLPIPR